MGTELRGIVHEYTTIGKLLLGDFVHLEIQNDNGRRVEAALRLEHQRDALHRRLAGHLLPGRAHRDEVVRLQHS